LIGGQGAAAPAKDLYQGYMIYAAKEENIR